MGNAIDEFGPAFEDRGSRNMLASTVLSFAKRWSRLEGPPLALRATLEA